ncbi:hypothetical protein ACSQ67_023985 [Phaseolus vulgaris]
MDEGGRSGSEKYVRIEAPQIEVSHLFARRLDALNWTSASPANLIGVEVDKIYEAAEKIMVTTQDDYILNLPRIRVGELRGPPVCSTVWALHGY